MMHDTNMNTNDNISILLSCHTVLRSRSKWETLYYRKLKKNPFVLEKLQGYFILQVICRCPGGVTLF